VGLIDGLAGQEVGRGQRPGQRRDRLDRAADDERLAVRDAAGQPARIVRAVNPAAKDFGSCPSVPNIAR